VQPVGAPVGRKITAVAPDRTLLHAAEGLPDILAALNAGAGIQHLAGRGLDTIRDRRRQVVNFAAKIQQYREHEDHTARQDQP